MLSQPPGSFHLLEPGLDGRPDSASIPMNPMNNASTASQTNNLPAVSLSNQAKGL